VKSYIHVSLDTEVPGGAGYIRYSREKAVRQEPMDEKLAVCVDLDPAGNVVGIELTSLDEYAFSLTDKAAAKYGLKVPKLEQAALALA